MAGRIVNDDDLERRVRAYGARWRDAHPFANQVDTAQLTPRSRGRAVAAVAAAVVVVVAAIGAAAVVRHDDASRAHPVAPSSTSSTSSTTAPAGTTTTRPREAGPVPSPVGAERTHVPLDRQNAPLAIGADKVWVGTASGVTAFDPVTLRTVGHVDTAQPVLELASSSDGIWLISGCTDNFGVSATPPLRLELIDPETLHVDFSTVLAVGGGGNRASGYCRYENLRLAAAPGAAWVAFGTSVIRADARTGAVTPISLSGLYAENIAADATGLWVECSGTDPTTGHDLELVHIDAATNKATPIPGLPAGFYWSIATTGDAAWTVAAVDSGSTLQLTRIDAVTHALTTSRIHGIALVAGDGQLWVQVIPPTGGSSLNYHSLIGQIDTATGQISRTVMISIGEEPGSAGNGYANPPFAVANGQIWSAYNGLQRTTPGAGGGTH